MLKKGTSLGMSVLRFLPKQGSLRPIMNMGRNASQLSMKVSIICTGYIFTFSICEVSR